MIKISRYIKENKIKFIISNLKFEFNLVCSISKGGTETSLRKDIYNKFYIVQSGSCILEVDKKDYLLKEGMFAVVPKGKENRIYNLSENFKRISLEVEFKKRSHFLEEQIYNCSDAAVVYDISENMQGCVRYILDYAKNEYNGYLIAVKNMITSTFFEMFNIMQIELASDSIYVNNNTENDKKIRQIEEYIYKNMSSRITAGEIAEYFNVSVRQLDRIMLKYNNETLKEYINRLKRGKAREFLIVTDKNIPEIAADVGFACEHSFIRFFKRLEGITPHQFRKINKKQGD